MDHHFISDISRGSDNMAEYRNEQSMEDYHEKKANMHDMDHIYLARGTVSIIAPRRLLV